MRSGAVHVCAAVGKAQPAAGDGRQKCGKRGRAHAADAPGIGHAACKRRAGAPGCEHSGKLRITLQALHALDERGVALVHDGIDGVVVIRDGLGCGHEFQRIPIAGVFFQLRAEHGLFAGQDEHDVRDLQRAAGAALEQLLGVVAAEYVNQDLLHDSPVQTFRKDFSCVRGRAPCAW